jgi:type II secretory pathway component PulC
MKRDFSPEEKLLRLIKGPAKKDADKNKTETNFLFRQNGSGPAKSISSAMSFMARGINIKGANPVLLIIFICLLVYFLIDVAYNPYYKKETEIVAEAEKEPAAVKEKALSGIEPYSYYTSGVEGRNVFLPQESEVSPVMAGPSADEISSNLALIGIIAGDKPQAIIEDKKAGKSYFLYKGGLAGQAKIIDISEDRVTMEYNGQTFELVL